jgi:hypothetical protein
MATLLFYIQWLGTDFPSGIDVVIENLIARITLSLKEFGNV